MEVKTVGVYGAGLMGRGIAQVALEGGYDVVLYNHRTPTLEKGVAGIKKDFEKKVAKGKITQEQADGWLGHLKATIELEDLKDVDIVFEAMVENMALKKEAFAKMAPIIRGDFCLQYLLSEHHRAGRSVAASGEVPGNALLQPRARHEAGGDHQRL